MSGADREWVPFHSHPWDELTYVLAGEIEFRVRDAHATGKERSHRRSTATMTSGRRR
jgi:quercetin dioxygenase-like cupin family protein